MIWDRFSKTKLIVNKSENFSYKVLGSRHFRIVPLSSFKLLISVLVSFSMVWSPVAQAVSNIDQQQKILRSFLKVHNIPTNGGSVELKPIWDDLRELFPDQLKVYYDATVESLPSMYLPKMTVLPVKGSNGEQHLKMILELQSGKESLNIEFLNERKRFVKVNDLLLSYDDFFVTGAAPRKLSKFLVARNLAAIQASAIVDKPIYVSYETFAKMTVKERGLYFLRLRMIVQDLEKIQPSIPENNKKSKKTVFNFDLFKNLNDIKIAATNHNEARKAQQMVSVWKNLLGVLKIPSVYAAKSDASDSSLVRYGEELATWNKTLKNAKSDYEKECASVTHYVRWHDCYCSENVALSVGTKGFEKGYNYIFGSKPTMSTSPGCKQKIAEDEVKSIQAKIEEIKRKSDVLKTAKEQTDQARKDCKKNKNNCDGVDIALQTEEEAQREVIAEKANPRDRSVLKNFNNSKYSAGSNPNETAESFKTRQKELLDKEDLYRKELTKTNSQLIAARTHAYSLPIGSERNDALDAVKDIENRRSELTSLLNNTKALQNQESTSYTRSSHYLDDNPSSSSGSSGSSSGSESDRSCLHSGWVMKYSTGTRCSWEAGRTSLDSESQRMFDKTRDMCRDRLRNDSQLRSDYGITKSDDVMACNPILYGSSGIDGASKYSPICIPTNMDKNNHSNSVAANASSAHGKCEILGNQVVDSNGNPRPESIKLQLENLMNLKGLTDCTQSIFATDNPGGKVRTLKKEDYDRCVAPIVSDINRESEKVKSYCDNDVSGENHEKYQKSGCDALLKRLMAFNVIETTQESCAAKTIAKETCDTVIRADLPDCPANANANANSAESGGGWVVSTTAPAPPGECKPRPPGGIDPVVPGTTPTTPGFLDNMWSGAKSIGSGLFNFLFSWNGAFLAAILGGIGLTLWANSKSKKNNNNNLPPQDVPPYVWQGPTSDEPGNDTGGNNSNNNSGTPDAPTNPTNPGGTVTPPQNGTTRPTTNPSLRKGRN